MSAALDSRDALPATDDGPRRLVCLVLDDVHSVALGNEPVRTPEGEVVGRMTSGGQGFTTGASIAYAWVRVKCARSSGAAPSRSRSR
jgi:4-methylaminobutanoate oxidase (formaldehyde-forming)